MNVNGKRITAITLAFLSVVLVLFCGCGGKAPKVYHVGILSGLDYFYPITDGFRERMTEFGYVEGENIFYKVHKTNFDMNAYRKIIHKFITDKVDLILVFPTEASMEAKSITKGTGIPVVFTNAFTENTELAGNVREPGGNITGVRWDGPDLALQRFEIMRKMLPQAKHIWVPYQRGYPIVNSQIKVLYTAFDKAGMEMTELAVSNETELDYAMRKHSAATRIPDAILIIAEPLTASPGPATVLADFAAKHGIPVGGVILPGEGNESIFGITPESIPQGRQAAFLADKIFRGTSAGSLPVITAENFLTINYKTAVKLGLKVDEGLLGRANKIIR